MIRLIPYDNKSHNNDSVYNPFHEMDAFERAMFGGSSLAEFRTDIRDNGDSYTIEADLPGFKKEDIHIDVEGDYMTVTAERHSEFEQKEKKNGYLRCERSYGSFVRSFNISEIDAEAIEASYTDGVLKLTLPKKKELTAQPKRVEVK
ncbi:MAG TPA: Hsp20/alpha crystallin family protein [Eubacteriales bacterium]|nr:Hsp20/alpha crystallin family protein [Clostridia bacterium]HRV72914.1 Hsp20/alpha crystallin family protein [Eubacteriales bacterium]